MTSNPSPQKYVFPPHPWDAIEDSRFRTKGKNIMDFHKRSNFDDNIMTMLKASRGILEKQVKFFFGTSIRRQVQVNENLRRIQNILVQRMPLRSRRFFGELITRYVHKFSGELSIYDFSVFRSIHVMDLISTPDHHPSSLKYTITYKENIIFGSRDVSSYVFTLVLLGHLANTPFNTTPWKSIQILSKLSEHLKRFSYEDISGISLVRFIVPVEFTSSTPRDILQNQWSFYNEFFFVGLVKNSDHTAHLNVFHSIPFQEFAIFPSQMDLLL